MCACAQRPLCIGMLWFGLLWTGAVGCEGDDEPGGTAGSAAAGARGGNGGTGAAGATGGGGGAAGGGGQAGAGGTPIGCDDNCHYVRADAPAGGDGSDWELAWPELPDELRRGHRYWIADGAYPAYRFDDAESATETILVAKATPFDPGATEAGGWDPSYGDGVAVFPTLHFDTSYVIVDGRVGQRTSGHGIEIIEDLTGPDDGVSLIRLEQDVHHIELRHLDVHRPTMDHRGSGLSATLGGNHDILVSHCYLHDVFGVHYYFIDATDVVIEHTTMQRNKSTADWHSESIQARGTVNLTVRHSWFEEIQGTGVIVSGSGDSSGWRIHGNVFDTFSVGHGVVCDNQNDTISDVLVYNNTILNGASHSGVRLFNATGDNRAINNLWYACDIVVHAGVQYDHNYYSDCGFTFAFEPGANEPPKDGTSTHTSIDDDPFVDAGGSNLQLAAPLDGYPGQALGPPYDVDMEGHSRGGDGVWDRGAFEFAE